MPHMIEVSDGTFSRMQKLAVPLVDTADSLVEKALTALEGAHGGEDRAGALDTLSARPFNPAAPPNLAHTTPNEIILCGVRLSRTDTYWNNLMIATIREAKNRGLSATQLKDMLTIKSLVGPKEDSGYRYLWDVGLSVQGQDANSAWRQTYDIAARLGLDIEVVFTWQNDPRAAMPNVTGRFRVGDG